MGIMLGPGFGFVPEGGFGLSGGTSHGSSLTVSGSGFGTKAQAAPVLWDFGDDVWVNGVNNTHHSTFTDGQAVPLDLSGTPSSAETGAMYRDESHNSDVTAAEFIVSDAARPWRHGRITHHYRGDGYRWLSWNWAQGATEEEVAWSTGKYYLATRYRDATRPDHLFNADYTGLSGDFDTGTDGEQDGELCNFVGSGDTYTGYILELDTGAGHVSCSAENGKLPPPSGEAPYTVTGQVSGAELTMVNTAWVGHPSHKHTRPIQDNNGTRSGLWGAGSFNQRSWWSDFYVAGAVDWDMDVDGGGLTPSEWAIITPLAPINEYPLWYLQETYVDCDDEVSGSMGWTAMHYPSVGFDAWAEWSTRIPVATQDQDRTNNPLASVFGPNGNGSGHAINIDWGEVYFDYTPQRVMIGDANTVGACTNMEFQRPTSWADDEATFVLNLGEFSTLSSKYLYVFDVDNTPILIGGWI